MSQRDDKSLTDPPVRNFSWVIPGELAGSAFPLGDEALAWLVSQEIREVISLSEELPPGLASSELESLHLPILDFTAPSLALIDRAVDFIERRNANGRPVLVHCRAGYGRTGTILACYLVATGLDAEGAIRRIRQLRPDSVETTEQVDVVRAYTEKTRA